MSFGLRMMRLGLKSVFGAERIWITNITYTIKVITNPYGTPAQIDALIREEVSKIGTKEGGLCMVYALLPGVPLENAKAVMTIVYRQSSGITEVVRVVLPIQPIISPKV